MPKINLVTLLHVAILFSLLGLFFLTWRYPLLSTLGFESANLLVTVFGPIFCVVAALNARRNFLEIFTRELTWLLVSLALFFGLVFLNGFYSASCSAGIGAWPFLVIGFPPLLLNIAVGSVVAAIFRNRLVKFLAVFFGYTLYYVVIALCWYFHATFRVFSHASFLMTSDLLQGDRLSAGVLGYRTATLLFAFAVIFLGTSFLSQKEKIFSSSVKRPWRNLFLIVLIFGSAILIDVESRNALGKNRESLVHDYQLLAEKDGLKIFADPQKITEREANDVLFEARFYRNKLQKKFKDISSMPITIWLHKNDDDKLLYTGARNVHFALPKHREIHISGARSPHGVLGHELAHIYVGESAQTLFGHPGVFLVVPNLALTEGLAMFLSKELYLENNLTLLEQAQALFHAGIIVDFDELFSNNPLYFARANPRVAYLYAGAMIDFFFKDIPPEEQAEKLQLIISRGAISALFASGDEYARKKALFVEHLKKDMAPDAIFWAKKSFGEPGILQRDCRDDFANKTLFLERALLNHDVNAVKAALNDASKNNQKLMLKNAIDRALREQAYDFAVALLAVIEPLVHDDDDAFLEELKFKKLDALIGKREFEDASLVVDAMQDRFFIGGEKRLVVVLKVLFRDYMEKGDEYGLSAATIAYLFAKSKDQNVKLFDFAQALENETKTATSNSEVEMLAHYILARFYMRNDQQERALKTIERALVKREYLPPLVEKAAMHMLAETQAQRGDREAARATYTNILARGGVTVAEELFIADQIERLQFKLHQ